ncbi:uncharacterized protein EI90DRAFT_3069095 [Cantharellus anzutake]|uniref:uncharacterized protein n=1 Tax=Cantharellus anzutake TaxID=1750568 RepID=UPI001904CA6A|nr:uncharacterized protein EI90DRAFT_3069095 [Cantharellus anzutake]KAF8326803.1 hypothetical protein EI90DRAFT_3069095 [Cantharellus anzutake]
MSTMTSRSIPVPIPRQSSSSYSRTHSHTAAASAQQVVPSSPPSPSLSTSTILSYATSPSASPLIPNTEVPSSLKSASMNQPSYHLHSPYSSSYHHHQQIHDQRQHQRHNHHNQHRSPPSTQLPRSSARPPVNANQFPRSDVLNRGTAPNEEASDDEDAEAGEPQVFVPRSSMDKSGTVMGRPVLDVGGKPGGPSSRGKASSSKTNMALDIWLEVADQHRRMDKVIDGYGLDSSNRTYSSTSLDLDLDSDLNFRPSGPSTKTRTSVTNTFRFLHSLEMTSPEFLQRKEHLFPSPYEVGVPREMLSSSSSTSSPSTSTSTSSQSSVAGSAYFSSSSSFAAGRR